MMIKAAPGVQAITNKLMTMISVIATLMSAFILETVSTFSALAMPLAPSAMSIARIRRR